MSSSAACEKPQSTQCLYVSRQVLRTGELGLEEREMGQHGGNGPFAEIVEPRLPAPSLAEPQLVHPVLVHVRRDLFIVF